MIKVLTIKLLKCFIFVSISFFMLSHQCFAVKGKSGKAKYKMVLFMPHVDEFWDLSTMYAQAAAEDLNIDLSAIDTRRDADFVMKETEQLCRSGIDGIIFHCADIDGENLLQITEKYKVPTFFINVDIKEADFYPRTKYHYWIGKMLPDDQHAGAVLAERLVAAARLAGEKKLHVLAVEGYPKDGASLHRCKGLEKYLQYLPDIESLEIVAAEWKPKKAVELFEEQYRANPKTNVVWAANDSMAVAILAKIKEMGIKKKIFVGGINWDRSAVKAVAEGDMHVTVGGHFLEGAWAVILIHDYLQGKDFSTEGLSFTTEMSALTSDNYEQVKKFMEIPVDHLDFSRLSKISNPGLSHYYFNFEDTIRAAAEPSTPKSVMLTPEEEAWIKEHPDVKVTIDKDWHPVEFVDAEGKMQGISADYLSLIGKKTGLKFSHSTDMTWAEAVQALKEGRTLLATAMVVTPQRKEFVDFTRPYLCFPTIIVTKKDISYIGKMRELSGKPVAIVEGYAIQDILTLNYPDIALDKKKSTLEALEAVSDGRSYAFIGDLGTTSSLMQKAGFSNLKISGKFPYDYDVAMGINNNHPILKSIIQKALDSISEEESSQIYDKWISVAYEHKTSFAVLWKTLVVAVIVVLAILFWTQRLYALNKALADAKLSAENAKAMAEKSSRMKSQFLANMSHEIRNPVNIISGFTELLEEKITDIQQSKYISSMRSAEKTLLKLTNDILDLSQIEASKLKLEPGEVDLKKLFDDLKHISTVGAGEHGLECNFVIDPKLPGWVILDERRLKQILFNLLNNAVKFTNSGYVQLAVKVLEASKEGCCDLSFAVKDTGIGIPKSDHDKIFNTFEQQSKQQHEKYGGAGLGLAICKKLTKMMGGEISVESSAGLGSTFCVLLHDVKVVNKAVPKEIVEPVEKEFSSVSLKSRVVLVADDLADNRSLFRLYLEALNATVIEAADGKEAVEKSHAMNFDLVIMDLKMPGMSGFEAAKIIKQESQIPIIALSGSVELSDAEELEKSNFDAFISKPVTREMVLQKVCAFIGKPREESGAEAEKKVPVAEVEEVPSFQEILSQLNNEVSPLWERAKISGAVDDISRFAKSVNLLGEQFEQKSLVDYGTHLLAALKDSDEKKICFFMEQYPKVIEYFESEAEKKTESSA